MANETGTALARLALHDVTEEDIDAELAKALMGAIIDYPSFETACAACGVTDRSIRSLLQRGVQPGASRSLKAFSKGIAKADAENAKLHSEQAAMYLNRNQAGSARIVLDIMERRWKLSETSSLMTILGSSKRSENLKARILHPSSVLLSLFRMAITSPNSTWAALLEECGWVKAAPKPKREEPEPEPDLEEVDE